MNLTEHFTLEELTHSQTAIRRGINNTPSLEIVEALTQLCTDLLEPARTLLNVPFHVDSGYRCAELNVAVGGSATSEHCLGHAADIIPQGLDLDQAFETLRTSDLPYDQIILECNTWIHLGLAGDGQTPRREALTAQGTPGHWTYAKV